MCKECKEYDECDRGRLLLEDPPRRDGMPSYSYQRVSRFSLSLAQEEWRRRTRRTLEKGGCPPPLIKVVPIEKTGEQ